MSRNIKTIGKELMGKSLNSFHRKIGLTQIEETNRMQDGILDGILSQECDAHIEKTEQSNTIHLDGSGDGVVVLGDIEGNTMINLWDIDKVKLSGQTTKKENEIEKTIRLTTTENRYSNFFLEDKTMFKPNIDYTFIVDIKKNTFDGIIYITSYTSATDKDIFNTNFSISGGQTGIIKRKLTTVSDFEGVKYAVRSFFDNNSLISTKEVELNIIILEGNWMNREIPASYFKNVQSSFEEKINNKNKYEIEILSQNRNLFDGKLELGGYDADYGNAIHSDKVIRNKNIIKVQPNSNMIIKGNETTNGQYRIFEYDINKKFLNTFLASKTQGFKTMANTHYINFHNNTDGNLNLNIQLEYGLTSTKYTPNKFNRIKLLVNEPLRATKLSKDVICVKNGKLTVERNCGEIILNGTENWNGFVTPSDGTVSYSSLAIPNLKVDNYVDYLMCGKIPTERGSYYSYNREMIYTWSNGKCIYIHITTSKLPTQNLQGFKTWLQNNPVKLVYQLEKPVYEEVLNEYGEPIILEGYENGTIYIDSIIAPTTTVRYAPKMESFKVLKEVENNNIMLTNDINDNIIPYMMDVDLMIMEKEMALMSHNNIRTIGVKDMTSMQKRTQDMLERLIKGKTLTEQECKVRVKTYLDAGKITETQKDELMLLISEVYV